MKILEILIHKDKPSLIIQKKLIISHHVMS